MNFRQDTALATLSRYRRDLVEAEQQGWAPRYLVDRAGGLRSSMEGLDLPHAVAEAAELYDRTMRLPMRADE